MEEKLVEALDRLLQTAGIDPVTGLVVLVAASAAIPLVRGLHALAQGWHIRRKEFVEMFEKLSAGTADPLALEVAVRHGFGVWLPATAIQRIREQPFASRCLRSLSDLEPFLEPDAAAGTFAIQPRFASPSRRTICIAMHYLAYLCGFLAAAYAFGLVGGAATQWPLAVRIALGTTLAAIGFRSLDVAVELGRLTEFLRRYPALIANDAKTGVGATSAPPSGGLGKLLQRWQRWWRPRHVDRDQAKPHVPLPPSERVDEAAARKSRSDSDASTPRA